MKSFARIDNNIVVEMIPAAIYDADGLNWHEGDEIPIEKRFTPEFVATLIDVTDLDPYPQVGWSYNNGVFTPYSAPPPTPAEILASQSAKLQGFTQLAAAQKFALTNRIGTLNDAIELEMATPAEETELPTRVLQLKAWKTYAVLLGRVTGQNGWPPEVVWPVQPTEGMDLTVSATTPEVV